MDMAKRICKVCEKEKELTHENWQSRLSEKQNKTYYSRKCRMCINEEGRLAHSTGRKTRASGVFKNGYTCIEEPEATGYLRSHFAQRMFENMLNDGTLPPGTVWQNERTGRKYKVVGNEVYHKFPERFDDAKGQKLRWVR